MILENENIEFPERDVELVNEIFKKYISGIEFDYPELELSFPPIYLNEKITAKVPNSLKSVVSYCQAIAEKVSLFLTNV